MYVSVRREVRGETNEIIGCGCWLWCPGCDAAHRLLVEDRIGNRPVWGWNGSVDKPTFTPSLLVLSSPRCHSFIRDGKWEFLSDSEHKLAGKTAEMVELPKWLSGEE